MKLHRFSLLLPSLLLLLTPSTVWAKHFIVRLICADQPDRLVSDVETKEQKPKPAEKQKAPPPPPGKHVAWMRFVTLDGRDAFKITYKGAFLKRSAVITAELDQGEHVVQPGDHRFHVRNGGIETEDPDLRAAGDGLDILCYPVTFVAVDASVIRRRPMPLKSLPLDIVIKHGDNMVLPVAKTFNPLLLYLVSNSKGKRYTIQPTGQAFRVTPDGVRIEDTEEAKAVRSGVSVENRFTVGVPSFSFPLEVTTRPDHKIGVKVYGLSGEKRVLTRVDTETEVRGFYSRTGSQIRSGHVVPSESLPLEGDVAAYPFRRIRVDARDPGSEEPRTLVAAWNRQTFQPGESLEVRVRYLDSIDKPTLSPTEVAVFLRERPVLREDGAAEYPKARADSGDERWTRLVCRQTSGQAIYRARIPERPTNIYLCRLAVDRVGQASPNSLLAADLHISLSSADTAGTLSVFTDSLRTSYEAGECLELNVVLKNRQPLAGTLTVTLTKDGSPLKLVEKAIPEQAPGRKTYTFRITPEGSAALAGGDYRLQAHLGEQSSNVCRLSIRQPVPKTHFPIFSYPWGVCEHLGATATREDDPIDREAQIRRNVRHLDHMGLNVLCPPEKLDSGVEPRESDTFSAVVEGMMRQDLGMPASELVYSRTRYEIFQDEMTRVGQRFMPQPNAGMMLSLYHSVPEDVSNTGRTYALFAQEYRRFPNWLGFFGPTSHICVLGNSEVGDPRWDERMKLLDRNYQTRYGHDKPRLDVVAKWVKGDRATRERLADADEKWMQWIKTINDLLPDTYRNVRQSVGELKPDLKLGAMTFQSCNAEYGEFITNMQEEMDVNLNSVGYGDYARLLPLESIVETMLTKAGGKRTAQWRDIGDGSTGGPNIAKVQFFKSLLGKVEGMGYFSYGGAYAAANRSGWFYDEYHEFNHWMTQYGDWYQSLELDTPVCIYLSNLDSAHDLGITRRTTMTAYLARGAAYELARAHRMAPMLGDERIREGELKKYRVVILPGVRLAPEDVREALEQFVRDGGIVMADEDTELEVEGATRIPKNFQAMIYPYYEIGAQYDGNRVFWEAYKRTRPEVAKLRTILDPIIPAFADAPTSRTLTSTMKHGEARYVFVVNDEVPYWTEHSHFGVQQYALPNKATVRIRDTECVIYSVQERMTVDGAKQDGARVLDVDFEFAKAQIYALLPRRIASFRLAASGSATPGQGLRVSAEVLDGEGKAISAAVPFELRVVDPAGHAAYHVYRTTTADGYIEDFPIAVNDLPGTWRVEAQERFAGHKAAVEFTVTEDAPAVAVSETSDVLVIEGARIRQFLNELKTAGHGLWLLLGRDQSLRLGPLAQDCAKRLSDLGVRTKVKFIDDPDVIVPPGRVRTLPPESAVLNHVLLIGSEGENRLIEEICDAPILLRRFTANYPGPGRALIQMARSPFSLGRHALLVLSNDQNGLKRGVERLLSFDEFDDEPDVLRRASLPPSKAEVRESTAGGPSRLNSLVAQQEGLPASVVAFSPDGDYFAVGCNWYFHNLFLFDRSGNLQWKQKVGRVDVGQITVGRGAERICVGTDRGTYLLDKSGRILWRLSQPAVMNAEGNLLLSAGDDLTMALRPDGSTLWVDDPWQEETDPWKLNRSASLHDVAFLEDGKTVVLRRGAAVEYREATTNAVLQRFQPQALVARSPKHSPRFGDFPFRRLVPSRNGEFVSLMVSPEEDFLRALPESFVFSRAGDLHQRAFLPPPYSSSFRNIDSSHLAADGTLYAIYRDSAYRVRPDGSAAWSYSFDRPLISGSALSPDGHHLAVASWGGKVALLDATNGRERWAKPIDSGAELGFSTGSDLLVVAGKTGIVIGLDVKDGTERFRHDLREGSFIPDIEDFWARHEQEVKQLKLGANPKWHEVVQKDVPLSPNLLGLKEDKAVLTETLDLAAAGDRLSTYFLAMRFKTAKGKASFEVSLKETDLERQERELRSGTFEARTFPTQHYWVLKLSDRPWRIQLRLQKQAGESDVVFDELRLQKMEFPSDNYLYHRGGYSQGLNRAVMENAPVSAAIFHMQWGAHATVWANPFYLMDGHVFKKQKELDDGWWFGGGGGSEAARSKITPCAMDIEFPEPKPISHIVLYDDEDGEPTERVCFQAWVDAKDLRRGKTEAEERMIAPGYWRTVGKGRWNRDHFQVHAFSDLVTRKIRFWYLRGPLKIDEIEIYGPEQKDLTNWLDSKWIARIPLKVNKSAELIEVEFQPQGLTRPDGADLRVVNPKGVPVPHVVKHLSPAGATAIVFKSDSLTGTYYLYLGNDEAEPSRYDWKPRGGIRMESYSCPGQIGQLNMWRVWDEAQMLKILEAAQTYNLAAKKKAEAEGKPFDGTRAGFVRAVGFHALPSSITKYSFFIHADEPRKLAFRTDAHSESVPSLLKLDGEIVFGGWNAFDPNKPPPDRYFMPGKHWGDAELKEGLNHFEFTYIGREPAPLSFRPAGGRVERFLIRSRHTTFPGARRVLPERVQLLEEQDLAQFYLARAQSYLGKDRLFDAQEMLLYATRLTRDPEAKSRAQALDREVGARICAANWPMFHGNPQRTGHASPRPAPGQDELPAQLGTFSRGAYQSHFPGQMESGIAATDLGTFFGVCDHRIRKVNGWFFTTSGVIGGTPLVYGQRLYCGSMDGNLYCLTAEMGELVWKFPTGDGVASSPLIIDGKLIFGSLDGYLYCLDPLTGQPVWKYRTGDWIESSPATDGQRVFVGSYDDCLHAIDLETGKGVWKLTTGFDVVASPCVQDGTVYCASFDHHVYAAKADDGALLWKTELGGHLSSSPAIADSVLVIGSHDGHVYALDARTGRVLWKHKTGGEVEASPSIIGTQVYAPSNDNHLYVFDLKSGKLLAKRPLAGNTPTRSFRVPPAYHRESLWIGGTTGIKNSTLQKWER